MKSSHELKHLLRKIDGRGYKAYREIQGEYDFGDFLLFIDHVQGDPFAAPSRVRVRVVHSRNGFPENLWGNRSRRIAFCDWLAREVRRAIQRFARPIRGTGKSGLIFIDAGSQEVLERTAAKVGNGWLEVRLQVGLPAAGRTILGREAEQIFFQVFPQIIRHSLYWKNMNQKQAWHFVNTVENYFFIQSQLKEKGLVAFVANGAILPRESGASPLPMPAEQAVAFQSPSSLEVAFQVPNPVDAPDGSQFQITGMGIPRGITLIVGGGYHGKSTLLNAIELGVYPHIPGDGREYAVTVPNAVKIRAEDGRRIEQVDISAFINNLPMGKSTRQFCTDDASGSTSQAANIVEALEVGAELLLVDEDTSATNFMVRDARMQALVAKENEPITPFIDRVQELFQKFGVSTILVMGGSGDYLDVADTVIMMHDFLPEEVTNRARAITRQYPTTRKKEIGEPLQRIVPRIPLPQSSNPSKGKKSVKIDAKGKDVIQFGHHTIDLRLVEQLVDISQTRAIGLAIYLARNRWMDGRTPLRRILENLEQFLDEQGLDALTPFLRPEHHPGNLARPRRFEIAAAINRLRSLRMRQQAPKE